MHYGAFIFGTGYSVRMDDLAVELESRGFESLFQPEHTHIPASRLSPWPGGGELPTGVCQYPRSVHLFSFRGARDSASKGWHGSLPCSSTRPHRDGEEYR